MRSPGVPVPASESSNLAAAYSFFCLRWYSTIPSTPPSSTAAAAAAAAANKEMRSAHAAEYIKYKFAYSRAATVARRWQDSAHATATLQLLGVAASHALCCTSSQDVCCMQCFPALTCSGEGHCNGHCHEPLLTQMLQDVCCVQTLAALTCSHKGHCNGFCYERA